MLIEFTGLPGAGKTTSESCIMSCYKQRGFQVVSRAELKTDYIKEKISCQYGNNIVARILSNRLYRLLRWKGLIDAGLSAGICREIFSKPRRQIFSWLGEDINLSTYFLERNASAGAEPGVYFSQEGFVHHSACFKVWGGFGFSNLPEILLQKIPSDKFIIFYFKITVEEALERLLNRGIPETWPTYLNSRERVKEILVRFDEAIEAVIEKYNSDGVKVLSIDSSLELHEVDSRLRKVIEGYLKEA